MPCFNALFITVLDYKPNYYNWAFLQDMSNNKHNEILVLNNNFSIYDDFCIIFIRKKPSIEIRRTSNPAISVTRFILKYKL